MPAPTALAATPFPCVTIASVLQCLSATVPQPTRGETYRGDDVEGRWTSYTPQILSTCLLAQPAPPHPTLYPMACRLRRTGLPS